MTTTYTARSGAPEVQDGPFADTKERLAGVFVIDVPDLDAALNWAGQCPAAGWGSIEIRPVAVPTPMARAGINPEQRVADLVAASYGRLLALLAAPTGDLPAAEDALADALERALNRWPVDGIPDNAEGWIAHRRRATGCGICGSRTRTG